MWGAQPWYDNYENDLSKLHQELLLSEKERYLTTLLLDRTRLGQCVRLVPFMLVSACHEIEDCYIWLPAEVSTLIIRLLVTVYCRGKQEHMTVFVHDSDPMAFREQTGAKQLLKVIHFFLEDEREAVENLENVLVGSTFGNPNVLKLSDRDSQTVLPFNLATHGCRKEVHSVFGDASLMIQTKNRQLALIQTAPHDFRMLTDLSFKPADIALLIVTASPQSPKPTLGDAQLENVRARGVQRFVVVVIVDEIGWAKERLDDFRTDMLNQLAAIDLGLSSTAFSFVPVSLATGNNIFLPYRDGGRSVSLISLLNSLDLHASPVPLSEFEKPVKPGAQTHGSCKAMILRSRRSNRLPNSLEVEVKVFLGTFYVDGTYFLSYSVPGSWLPVSIAEISSHFLGFNVEAATRGDVVRLQLVLASDSDSLVPLDDLVRDNDILLGEFLAVAPLATTQDVVVRLKISYLPPQCPIYCKGFGCLAGLVCGWKRNEIEVSSVHLLHELDLHGKIIKKNPVFVRTGSTVVAHLRCRQAAHFEKYSEDCRFGTLLLHDEGRILAFGSILALHAPIAVVRKKPATEPLAQNLNETATFVNYS